MRTARASALDPFTRGRGSEGGLGLGLSIVRTLVTTELNGTIEMRPATAADLAAVSLGDDSTVPHGTVVELSVPTVD